LDPAEARAFWPDSFLWLHPSLTFFDLPREQLERRIREMASAAGPAFIASKSARAFLSTGGKAFPAVLRTLSSL